MTRPKLTARLETWPLKAPFVISRSARSEQQVVVVEVTDGTHVGRGEGAPNARYGETPETSLAEIEAFARHMPESPTPRDITERMDAGAARNAVDCACWDFEAKKTGRRAYDLMGFNRPRPVETVYTISLAAPDDLATAARDAFHSGRRRLKLKFGGDGDDERIRKVRAAVPEADLVVDANEAWSETQTEVFLPLMADQNVLMVEQPLADGADDILAHIRHPVPVCADESCRTVASLDGLKSRYDMVNIKLDKTGGITEARALASVALEHKLGLMVGCMLGTSLAMAPAMLLAAGARIVDLDGPLLLKGDREPGLRYEGSLVYPPEPELWG